MTDLTENDDLPCCPDGTEPFPNFSVNTMEEISPCELTITRDKLIELTYSTGKGLKDIDLIRVSVAVAFMEHFKIKIDE